MAMIPNRDEAKAQTAVVVDGLDSILINAIGVDQRYVVDKLDDDGSTVVSTQSQTDDAIALLTTNEIKVINTILAYMDDVGPDTFYKAGGADGVNFRPTRDNESAMVTICRLVYKRTDPIGSGVGPYFA